MAKILELQGLPADAINLITDLYRGSKTIVSTPVGNTGPILHHGRGTVQGDPLSPRLFILVIDPLLRWLEEGNRGYEFKTSHERITSLAYADDLAVAAPDMRNLAIQATKITKYCEWAGLKVNVDVKRKNKTAWTCPDSKKPHDQTMMIMGKEIPKIKATESYVYLGVHVSLKLKWRDNAKAML